MNIIKEICTKHNGIYSTEERKNLTTSKGAMVFQFQKGEFVFEGKRMILMIDDTGGTFHGTNPFRFILSIENPKNKTIRIYPKFFIDKVFDLILNRTTNFIPKELRKKFQFNGDRKLLDKILADRNIVQLLMEQNLTIFIENKNPNRLILSPSRGIRNIEQAELFIELLKRVGEKI